MKSLLLLSASLLVLSSCHKDDNNSHNDKKSVVYFESNDEAGNSIFAYVQKADMTLQAIAGSPFSTGGKGLANPTQALGPDDADNSLVITDDGNFLLAVNPGSDDISVFKVSSNGALVAVPGSPFESNGPTPESIAINGKYVYIANKGNSDAKLDSVLPNYTVMTIDNSGKLTPVENSTFETNAGVSPSQVLLSNNNQFLFTTDFLGFMLDPAKGSLRSFKVGSDGKLAAVDGTPAIIPAMGGALGLWQHPSANILYVGFPVEAKVAVYNIDNSTGALSFSKTVDAGPAACWLRTDSKGKNLYSLNSGANTVSVFDIADPASPVSKQKIELKNSGPDYTAMDMTFKTSQDFSFDFSKDGKTCFIISQHTNKDFSIGNYNYLHVMTVAGDGMLSEPGEPMQIPVASTVRPQGIVTAEVR